MRTEFLSIGIVAAALVAWPEAADPSTGSLPNSVVQSITVENSPSAPTPSTFCNSTGCTIATSTGTLTLGGNSETIVTSSGNTITINNSGIVLSNGSNSSTLSNSQLSAGAVIDTGQLSAAFLTTNSSGKILAGATLPGSALPSTLTGSCTSGSFATSLASGTLVCSAGLTGVSGTFTPTVAYATPGTGSSVAYTTQTGTYSEVLLNGTPIQYCVTVDIVFTPTIGTGTSGNLQFSEPFTNPATEYGGVPVTDLSDAISGVTGVAFSPTASHAYGTILKYKAAALPNGTFGVGDVSSGTAYTVQYGGCWN